jgi:hypothetical protein
LKCLHLGQQDFSDAGRYGSSIHWINPNDNSKDHQDIGQQQKSTATPNNDSDPVYHPSHPSGDAGNTVNQLANVHLQDISGFVFHFCIRLQIAMFNGFNASAPRTASAAEHNCVTVLCLFVVMASFVAIK